MIVLEENTLSVCETCYRHSPAKRFLRDGQIWLGKTCPEHGYIEHLVEPDGEFYLEYKYLKDPLESYFIDITNRCNLACPHCYQMPNNFSKDPSIESILELIRAWPNDGLPIALVGAEPTVRKDLPEVIESIQNMPGKPRGLIVLSNCVNLSDPNYAQKFQKFKNLVWSIGLNHPDYQGPKVREKQMQGIDNCIKFNLKIKNISYTLEDLTQLEYCLEEIQQFKELCDLYRVRCGADIGRYPGGPKIFLSDLVKETIKISNQKGWTVEKDFNLGNRAHYGLIINGIIVKVIQWPDAKTLDLKEKQTEALADIVPGKPLSPLAHQAILRDAMINKGLPLYDTIPDEYVKNYGKW